MSKHRENNIVFLAGNYEAQRLASYLTAKPEHHKSIVDTVRRHFIYSCLLADKVIQPVANYYQSAITQKITDEYYEFFRPYKENPPVAYYAVSYYKETYEEDAKEKAHTYTKEYPCYKDPIIRERLTAKLDHLAEPLWRRGKLVINLSDNIIRNSTEDGKLFNFINDFTHSYKDTILILKPLTEVAEERKYALIPEYLEMKTPKQLSKYYVKLMRLSLLESYTIALKTLYDAYPFNALHPFYREVSFPYELNYLDTQLFSNFIKLIPSLEATIIKGKPKQILELKYSKNFRGFVSYYKELIERLKTTTMEEFEKTILQDYELQTQIYQKKLVELLKDNRLVVMLYESMNEVAHDKKFIQTSHVNFSYANIPIYGLVSEVIERFTNKYETMLINLLSTKVEIESLKHDEEDKRATQDGYKLKISYMDILQAIYTIGVVFEKLPDTYIDKKEEELRDHILIHIESLFEGSATGESINKTGKTDILVRKKNTNFFIAECKYWNGKKGYLRTITQLLTYLTWRDTQAAVIIFVRNKNFSSTIQTVEDITQSHTNYLGFVNKMNESWFNFIFHNNEDKKREIKLAVLLFHVPILKNKKKSQM